MGEVVIDGQPIEYAAFVAPALLAASAFNGAFYDATNIFWKLRYQKLYDGYWRRRSGRGTSRSVRRLLPSSAA